jgi:surface carbohydrate biosynthesis protein (TIGR04326 family)
VLNKSVDKLSTFLVWDAEDAAPRGDWTPVLWRSYGNGEKLTYSIPRIVEEKADELRNCYLDWIYDIGELRIKGKRVVDHLELRAGFSYWWMTLIAEKSNAYKSPWITDALKMLALESLVADHSISKIIIASNNKPLIKTFQRWCSNNSLLFEMRLLQKHKVSESRLKMIYHLFPHPVQAIISLIHHIYQRWPLKQGKETDSTKEITFVDYMIHLDQKALANGQYASNFWTGLVEALRQSGCKVNWLHHYIQHDKITSARQARDLIASFNRQEDSFQHHCFVDSTLNASLLLSVMHDYISLLRMNSRLISIKQSLYPRGSKIDFWPLFKKDWRNSMLGPNAIWNCLVLNLLERILWHLPKQKLGIYLQENQGWEMAFIRTWRAAGHGCLIGVPHSTVRYWDLRYFYNSRSYERTGENDLPIPDKVAINGPASSRAYCKGNYPEDQMVGVEALRYLHLANHENAHSKGNKNLIRILILGDYLPAVTYGQMKLLVQAAPFLPPSTRYTVKPHPACPVLPQEYPSLQLHMANEPLSKLLADCDVVFTSNITSAAVDAYCAGVPVVSVLEGTSLNLSPLRGMKGINFVTCPKELAEKLCNIQNYEGRMDKPYFCLDSRLPRWKKLLMDCGHCKSLNLTELDKRKIACGSHQNL